MQTTDYEAQAQAFLDRFQIKFRATLSDSKVAPWADGERTMDRHHYRVTLSKGAKEEVRTYRGDDGCMKVGPFQYPGSRITFDFFGSIQDCRDNKHPTPYDVLSCISGDVHCADTFEDFCGEFGESKDSIKALQTFRRCSAFSKRLKAFLTSEEIEALGEIA